MTKRQKNNLKKGKKRESYKKKFRKLRLATILGLTFAVCLSPSSSMKKRANNKRWINSVNVLEKAILIRDLKIVV